MARIDDYKQALEIGRKKLAERNPDLAASFAGAEIERGKGTQTSLTFPFLNRTIRVDWPDLAVSHVNTGDELPIQQQILVVHYLNGAFLSSGPEQTGEWIAFQDVPDGGHVEVIAVLVGHQDQVCVGQGGIIRLGHHRIDVDHLAVVLEHQGSVPHKIQVEGSARSRFGVMPHLSPEGRKECGHQDQGQDCIGFFHQFSGRWLGSQVKKRDDCCQWLPSR